MELVAELSKVIESAMHYFDALPNAGIQCVDVVRDLPVDEVRTRSSRRLWWRVVAGVAFLCLFWLARGSLPAMAAIGVAMVVGGLLSVRHGRRAAREEAVSAFGPMDERLRTVVEQLAAFRQALPHSHARLAMALEAVEERMLRIFTNRDTTLETALVKLTCKVFGYPGFDRLAASATGVSKALWTLRFSLAQEAAVRTSKTAS